MSEKVTTPGCLTSRHDVLPCLLQYIYPYFGFNIQNLRISSYVSLMNSPGRIHGSTVGYRIDSYADPRLGLDGGACGRWAGTDANPCPLASTFLSAGQHLY